VLKAFLRANADLTKPTTEEARRLHVITQRTPGLERTTEGSIVVAICAARRAQGIPAPPRQSRVGVPRASRNGMAPSTLRQRHKASLPPASRVAAHMAAMRNAKRAKAEGKLRTPAEDSFLQMATDLKAGIDLLIERYQAVKADAKAHADLKTRLAEALGR
jgi:hypothetical protein